MEAPLVVVVTGPPAAGKTTVAREIARSLRLPLVAKDTIKEALFDAFDTLEAMLPAVAGSVRQMEIDAERCAAAGVEVRIPPIRYCTDNGAMIAALGSALVRAGVAPSPLDLAVDSSMALSLVSVPA